MQERRTLMDASIPSWAKLTDGSLAEACDVLFSKNDGSELAIFKEDYWPDRGWTPIGIVVVPGSHNRYGDNTCGVMSLTSMDRMDSGNATNPNIMAYVGTTNYTLLSNVNTCSNSYPRKVYCNIPALNPDYSMTVISQDAVYWPYVYDETLGYTDEPHAAIGDSYSLGDFNGIKNTVGYGVVSESVNVRNNAFLACERYSTIGTNSLIEVYGTDASFDSNYGTINSTMPNTGYWYLPAEGEISYIPSKIVLITLTIYALNLKYSTQYYGYSGSIWSSTLNGPQYAWTVNVGGVNVDDLNGSNNAHILIAEKDDYNDVKAFLRF